MLKKILFLLNALFFCMNIFSSEVVLQTLKWLDYNIPQEIAFKIISYCDLADFGNCKSVCKHFNNFDLNALICPTHKENNHKCSSIHLSYLTNDYDRCTYILHCIANRENKTNPLEFNSKSEENLFSMIFFLHKRERETLIQKTHPTVKQELFTNKLRRDYYQYTELNTCDLLYAAIKKNKLIRFKQILQSSNQYITKVLTGYSIIISNILKEKNMIELLLSTSNDIIMMERHNLWQEIVLTVYQDSHQHKDTLIKFLLSDTFKHINQFFSADFYIKNNGFLSICSESDFDLISDRCDKNAIFDPEKIKCMDNVCKIKNFNFSIKIIEWLINKKIDFNKIRDCGLWEAYKSNNIELVKLLIQQGIEYHRLFYAICTKDDTDLATWILDNNSNTYKDMNDYYNNCIIYQACETLSVKIIELLFIKKIPINFYRNYARCELEYCPLKTLFSTLIYRQKDSHTKKTIKKKCDIIKLFLDNGLDLDKECYDQITYKKKMKQHDYLRKLLPCPNSIKNETPTEKDTITKLIEKTPIIETFPTNDMLLKIFIIKLTGSIALGLLGGVVLGFLGIASFDLIRNFLFHF